MLLLYSTVIAPIVVGIILALFKQWLSDRSKK